jgi:hypothetical protein
MIKSEGGLVFKKPSGSGVKVALTKDDLLDRV